MGLPLGSLQSLIPSSGQDLSLRQSLKFDTDLSFGSYCLNNLPHLFKSVFLITSAIAGVSLNSSIPFLLTVNISTATIDLDIGF